MSIITSETVVVGVDELKPYDKNPRIGDVGAIAESLEENAQYRPIVVQKSTKKILAGNHTWQAAKHLGWDEIAVVFVDVDDERAKKIVLADNRTNDLAGYDTKALTELLDSIPDPVGTGYSNEDVQVLLDQLESDNDEADELIDEIIRPRVVKSQTLDEAQTDALEDEASKGGSVGGINRPNFADDQDIKDVGDPDDDVHNDALLDFRADLEAYEVEIWNTNSEYGIPLLAKNMLLDELPDTIDTWVGAIHHDEQDIEDEDRWWFYNYSVGIKKVPFERCIMAFHVFDEKFENWWHLPAYYVAKFYMAGVRISCVPDYSLHSAWPQALNIYNVYRNYWLGRFFQQAGWKVIPNIWRAPEGFEFYWDGIPRNPPIASIQLQTTNKDEMDEERIRITRALDEIKPELLVVYAGDSGAELAEDAVRRSSSRPEIRHVTAFAKKKTELGVFKKDRAVGTKRTMSGMKPESDEEE